MRRGFREKLVPRVRKASKERVGGPDRPSGRKGRTWCAGASGRSWSYGSARHPRRGRLTGRGRWARPAPGEKRESLVRGGTLGARESLVYGAEAIQGRRGRGPGPSRREKRESLVCRGFREKLVPRVRKASKGRPACKGDGSDPSAPGRKGRTWCAGAPGLVPGPQGIQGEVGLQGRWALRCLVRRDSRESLALRVRKAFKGRPVHKGRWARPAPGEKKGEPGVQGLQGEVGPTGPQGIQGEAGLQGRWARPAPGEKRENLAIYGPPKEPRVRQGQWEHKGRQDRRGLPGKHRKLRWKRTPP